MEGFLSCSLSLDAVLEHYVKFNKNTLLEIRVDVECLKGYLDWGFASIKHCSKYKNEDEVLFNPINIFKVHACMEEQERELYDGT